MTRARDIANLVDANGDIVAGALDNVPAADVVNDTTPQLGGDLSTNGNDITFGDNDKAIFGAGSDFQVFHNGSNTILQNTGTGEVYIGASGTQIWDEAFGEPCAKFFSDSDVELYHDGSLKFETTSTGVSVTGNATFADNGKAIFGAGNDLEIYHSGSHSFITDNGGGDLYIRGSDNIRLQVRNSGDTAWTNAIKADDGAATSLMFDGSIKLATTSTGVNVTGNLTATSTAKGFGRLDATGTLTLQTQSLNISSVVDNSTGNHTINVTNSYSDAEYTIPSSIGQLTNAGTHTHIGVHTYYQTASLYKLQVFHGSGAGDSEAVDSATFGALA